MPAQSASAIAHPNIAFVKYWGNRDDQLRLPANASLSMNLAALYTTTTVTFDARLTDDEVVIDDQPAAAGAFARVRDQLQRVRQRAALTSAARVVSHNNFAAGAGLASSASAFAALTLAACAAAGLQLSEAQLSALARRASGSACRSVPAGYTRWDVGHDDASSFAYSLAPPDHWQLCDVIAVVSREHKSVGSSQGHTLAAGSPLHAARLAVAPALLVACQRALLARDLAALGPLIEQDTLLMHAVMLTAQPALIYWQPATLALLHAVRAWRAAGLPVYFSLDAGPNVHLICEAAHAPDVVERAAAMPGVLEVLVSGPGGAAVLVKKRCV